MVYIYQNMAVPCSRSSADDRWTILDFCSCFNVYLRKKCLTVLIIGDLLSGAVLIMPWQILTRDCTTSSEMFAFAWNRKWHNVIKYNRSILLLHGSMTSMHDILDFKKTQCNMIMGVCMQAYISHGTYSKITGVSFANHPLQARGCILLFLVQKQN